MSNGNSLAVQWLGLLAFTSLGPGWIPGGATKIPQAMRHGQKKKKERENVPTGTLLRVRDGRTKAKLDGLSG